MSMALLIFLVLVFFLIFKFTAAFTAIVAIIAGTTTLSILVSVWLGTSYHLRRSGYNPNSAEETYRQVDSDLNQIVGDLQEIRSGLEAAESYLRDVEFLRYARQNSKTEN